MHVLPDYTCATLPPPSCAGAVEEWALRSCSLRTGQGAGGSVPYPAAPTVARGDIALGMVDSYCNFEDKVFEIQNAY